MTLGQRSLLVIPNLSDQGQAASQRGWARMEEAPPASCPGGWSALRVAEVSIWTVPGGDKIDSQLILILLRPIHWQLILVLLRLIRAGRLCFCRRLLLRPCPVPGQKARGCGVQAGGGST